MGDHTAISWTDSTWTPIRMGRGHICLKLSDGCQNCYASRLQGRLGNPGYVNASADSLSAIRGLVEEGAIRLDDATLRKPLSWRKPRRVFVASMTDLFLEAWPDEWVERIFMIMEATPQHTYQVLTKRPARMRDWLKGSRYQDHPLPNVWLGVSVESDAFTWRAKVLAECPAAVRFVSAEPLLGPLPSLDFTRLDWIIVGGESGGPPERRMNLDWARGLRARAEITGTPFFFKQGSGPRPGMHPDLDGVAYHEWPAGVA
jgi:protein gp37